MARDKNGSLIPRTQQTQEAFNRHLSQIKDNWGVEPLLAIPDVGGLRPKDLDEIGVDLLHLLMRISKIEPRLAIVRKDMVAERDSRIRIKPSTYASDLMLKAVDLKNLCNMYRSRSTAARSRTVSGEIELPMISLEPRKTRSTFAGQLPSPPEIQFSNSDPLSPQMLTRLGRKRKYGSTTKSPTPVARKRPHLAEVTERPKAQQTERSPPQQQQLSPARKRTDASKVNLAGVMKETLSAKNKSGQESEEPAEAAMTGTVSDLKEVYKPSVPLWHRYINTRRSAPIVNPVRLEVNRLRMSCGDMMFFIEGTARNYKSKPLTESQKEALACASEVCEMALKNILDGYLKKLEDADIIPQTLEDPLLSTQASTETSDVDSDVDIAGPGLLSDNAGLPEVPLTPQPQHFRGYAGLHALNDNMTAQIEVVTDTSVGFSTSKPLRIGMAIPSDPSTLTASQGSLLGPLIRGGIESEDATTDKKVEHSEHEHNHSVSGLAVSSGMAQFVKTESPSARTFGGYRRRTSVTGI